MNSPIAVNKFDPITVEVVRNKLDGIAEEMQMTLVRSSFSPFVKEGLDASVSLFTLEGETLAQATAIPIHLATMIPMVRRLCESFAPETMRPDDLYIMNDPYLGGTHLPDILVMAPVFHDGRPIAFTAAITHHQDVGGMTPGSVPTNATDIFQEGLRIPPLRLRRDGVFDDTLLAMLRLNVRTPQILMGDINAQIAACATGERRLKELAGVYGSDLLVGIFNDLLDRAETMTRQALRKIPEGTYTYTDHLDNDGVDLDQPVRVQVAVTIRDGEMVCDFSESNQQVRGPFNSVPSGALAAGCFAIRVLGGASIPTNGGCFRPLTIKVKKGTIFDPVEPAPVNARTATLKRAANTLLSALRSAVPDMIPADPAASLTVVMLGGRRMDGREYVLGQAITGGGGANRNGDGIDVIETDVTNTMNQPVEALEIDAPIFVRTRRLRKDSGGAGQWRGGMGIHVEYELLEGELTLTYRGERHNHPAQGVEGGGAGSVAQASIVRHGGSREPIPSKTITSMTAGDVLLIDTAGGGGYGQPALRDPERLRDDIRDGKLSEAAGHGYTETQQR